MHYFPFFLLDQVLQWLFYTGFFFIYGKKLVFIGIGLGGLSIGRLRRVNQNLIQVERNF